MVAMNSHTRTPASTLAYVVAFVVGTGGWLYLGASTAGREGCDNPLYFRVFCPALQVVALALGFLAPNRPWRWGLVLFGGQALAALVAKPTAGLLPLGLILFGILAQPCVGFSYAGAFLRRAVGKRKESTGAGA